MLTDTTKKLEMKYFVVNPNKQDISGIASRRAVEAYARVMEENGEEQFAKELREWIKQITKEIYGSFR